MPQGAGSRLVVVVDPGKSSIPTLEHGLREARDAQAEEDRDVTVYVNVIGDGKDSSIDHANASVERTVESFDVDTRIETIRIRGDDRDSRTASLLDALDERPVSRLVLAADTEFSVE